MDVLLTALFYVYLGLVVSTPLLLFPSTRICRKLSAASWKSLLVLVPVAGLALFTLATRRQRGVAGLLTHTSVLTLPAVEDFRLLLVATLALGLALPLTALRPLSRQAKMPSVTTLLTIVPFGNVAWLSMVARRLDAVAAGTRGR
jgi:hypothetical protein